jgi:CheY-like chemotaxis protein
VTAGRERLLLVDDEELITDMFDTILTRLGYQVMVFNDSLEALAFITQDSTAFDLLVTDMSMPNLTGLELVQKTLAVRPDLPVILCTGFNQMLDKKEAKALGIHSYLEKPVSVKDLTEAIRQALDDK